MTTQRHLKIIVNLVVLILMSGTIKAQIGDTKLYPYTTNPNEKKDSTRGHIWGYVFGSAYTKLHADSINTPSGTPKTGATQYTGVPANFSAFSFQRVYLGYDYFFNNKFSAHIILAHEEFYDGGSNSASKDNVDLTGDRTLFIKYCNFEWDNIFKGSDLTVGAVNVPAYTVTEDPIWGYRSLERTIMDMRGIVTSNDVGAILGGKFWSKKDVSGKENAAVGYHIMVGNNTNATPDNVGLTAADISNYKRFYGDVYVKLFGDKLMADWYSDYHTVTPGQNNLVWRGLIGYRDRNWNLFVSYFNESLGNQAVYAPVASSKVLDTAAIERNGLSIAGAVTLIRNKTTHDPELGLVARYDLYNPDADFNANYKYATAESNTNYNYSSSNAYTENFFLFGVDYQPINQIHIMPNIWYDGFNNRANGVTGRAKSDDDLVARITFYFLFYKSVK